MRLISAFCVGLVGLSSALNAQSSGSTILVLDGSGSMWGQIEGTAKISIAQDVVAGLLSDLPEEQSLGLTVYGHRRKGDCSDIETLVAPGTDTRDAIRAAIKGVSPKGKTPMTDAVISAAEALRYTEEKATVILVSDGIETCTPDPCAAARALEDAGVDFTVHVVGFDVTDPEALTQMQCLASETGGIFRTASSASELSEALETAVQEPEPVPVMLSLEARLDGVTGPLIEGNFLWDLTGPEGDVLNNARGNPVVQQVLPGEYSVSATWLEQELEKSIDVSISRSAEQSSVVTFSIPDPTATLDAPASAPSGSRIEVGWSGPSDSRDNIQVARPGEGYLQYTYVDSGNPVTLQLPGKPGEYELRYVWQDRQIIATVPITVTESELSLNFPAEVPLGSTFEVNWAGPDVQGDNIQIGPVGGGYSHYVYTRDGNPVQMIAPGIPGDYEVRYSFQDRENILTVPIKVVEAPLSLDTPESVPGGIVLDIPWEGPNASGDNVQVGPVGGSYTDYMYTRDGNPVRLTMPFHPGVYELRYRFRDRETILTRQITITQAPMALNAPDKVAAGADFQVTWQGPDAPGDNVQIAVVNGSYLDYSYTNRGNPVTLRAPDTPGDYELRYSFRDRETVLSVPIVVE